MSWTWLGLNLTKAQASSRKCWNLYTDSKGQGTEVPLLKITEIERQTTWKQDIQTGLWNSSPSCYSRKKKKKKKKDFDQHLSGNKKEIYIYQKLS